MIISIFFMVQSWNPRNKPSWGWNIGHGDLKMAYQCILIYHEQKPSQDAGQPTATCFFWTWCGCQQAISWFVDSKDQISNHMCNCNGIKSRVLDFKQGSWGNERQETARHHRQHVAGASAISRSCSPSRGALFQGSPNWHGLVSQNNNRSFCKQLKPYSSIEATKQELDILNPAGSTATLTQCTSAFWRSPWSSVGWDYPLRGTNPQCKETPTGGTWHLLKMIEDAGFCRQVRLSGNQISCPSRFKKWFSHWNPQKPRTLN